MFSNEDLTFTNFQRVSNKKIVKSTKRVQIIRIETIKVKKAKIHERSIEFLIFLIFETRHFELKSALFLNKHVFFQSNYFDLDSFINVVNITNFNISNQNSSESHVVTKSEIIYDSIDIFFLFSSQSSKFSSTQRSNDFHEMYRLRIIIRQQQSFSTFSIHFCRSRSSTRSHRFSTKIFFFRLRSFCRNLSNAHVVKFVSKSKTFTRTISSSIR